MRNERRHGGCEPSSGGQSGGLRASSVSRSPRSASGFETSSRPRLVPRHPSARPERCPSDGSASGARVASAVAAAVATICPWSSSTASEKGINGGAGRASLRTSARAVSSIAISRERPSKPVSAGCERTSWTSFGSTRVWIAANGIRSFSSSTTSETRRRPYQRWSAQPHRSRRSTRRSRGARWCAQTAIGDAPLGGDRGVGLTATSSPSARIGRRKSLATSFISRPSLRGVAARTAASETRSCWILTMSGPNARTSRASPGLDRAWRPSTRRSRSARFAARAVTGGSRRGAEGTSVSAP
jgi:hypothetical protein